MFLNVDVIVHIAVREELGYFLSGNFSNDQRQSSSVLQLFIATEYGRHELISCGRCEVNYIY